MVRAPEEFKAAVDSMFRIRAVESPPDAAGTRTIWHRGTRGAELVTRVDATGRVARQDFTIFEELICWDREAGFRTGLVQAVERDPSSEEGAVLVPDGSMTSDRVLRAASVLAGYSGQDRFLLHLRDRLAAANSTLALGDDRPITRSAPVVLADLSAARPAPSMSTLAIAVAVLAGALFIGAMVMFYLSQ